MADGDTEMVLDPAKQSGSSVILDNQHSGSSPSTTFDMFELDEASSPQVLAGLYETLCSISSTLLICPQAPNLLRCNSPSNAYG